MTEKRMFHLHRSFNDTILNQSNIDYGIDSTLAKWHQIFQKTARVKKLYLHIKKLAVCKDIYRIKNICNIIRSLFSLFHFFIRDSVMLKKQEVHEAYMSENH